MDNIVVFELQADNFYMPTYGINLLFALGEELTLKCKRVNMYHRVTNDIIRVEFRTTGDEYRDLALLLNSLRISKNEAARACSVTRI